MTDHVDLFSGIGGFALAAHKAGLNTALFCEKEPYAQQVLNRHWPDVPIIDDIHDLTYERYVADVNGQRFPQQPQPDGEQVEPQQRALRRDNASGRSRPFLLTGGFPCQPFSQAGNRKGTEDDRHLWPEMVRVIDELRPTWVLGENVDGLLSMDGGRLIDEILTDLDGIGYESQAVVIPAIGVGAPHRRYRVWIVGHRLGAGLQGHAGDVAGGHEPGRVEAGSDGSPSDAGVRADVPDASKPEPSRRDSRTGRRERGAGDTTQGRGNGTGIRQPQPRLGGVLDGLPDRLDATRWPAPLGSHQYDWEPPRVTERKKNRTNRLKGLGNAIVPQVAYEIIRLMR